MHVTVYFNPQPRLSLMYVVATTVAIAGGLVPSPNVLAQDVDDTETKPGV